MQEDQSEQELIVKAQAGATDAFEILVRRYQGFIVNFVFRMTNDKEAALDRSQEVFIKAFRSLNSFQSRSSFRTWLASIAVNTTKTYLKKNRVSTSPLSPEFEPSSESLTPEDSLAQERRRAKLRAALSMLKPELQEVIRLCAIEGFSYNEASEALKIPYGTVCSRMNAALNELRAILSKEASDE